MISFNLKHLSKIKVTQDNVRWFNHCAQSNGKLAVLDQRPYLEMFNEFGVFYRVLFKN
jgi:hypothetical protein